MSVLIFVLASMLLSAFLIGLSLPYVLSRNLSEDLNYSPYRQLEELQKLTDEIDARGTYDLPLLLIPRAGQSKPSFHIFTRSNSNGTQVSFEDANKIAELSSFNISLKTVTYTHGWIERVNKASSVTVRDSLLEAENLNVLLVDWDECANSINYLTSFGCVEDVGNYLGEFLAIISQTYGYSLDDVTVVGHSLGAHISGYAGKYNNGRLGAIVGLDPAGPLFFRGLKNARLNENDAQYVQAIHTSATFLGVNYNVGHADFWPNGGFNQVGCGLDLECSHIRAFIYYAESVISNSFIARQCDGYDNFEDNECNNNSKGRMGGLNLDTSVEGSYYLETNEESPFGKGDL